MRISGACSRASNQPWRRSRFMAAGFLTETYRRLVDRFDRRDEREFLPAALEVVETPASPIGRLLGLVIVAFFTIAVAWAFLGRVDVITTAPGRLVPAGEVKVIQPLDPGIVRAIHVQDGDHVVAGQLLIELDPTQPEADRDRVSSDLMQANLDVARLTALKIASATGRTPELVPPPNAPPALVSNTRTAMMAQADQEAAKLAEFTEQISQKGAEGAEVGAQVDEINATLPMLTEKVRIHRELTAQGYGTSLAYQDAQLQLTSARHELAVQAQRANQDRDSQAALAAERESTRAQYAADILADLRKAEAQQSELNQQLIQAQSKSAQTSLRAPIAGVVDQLAVHTLHGVVTPAEHLMIVVPDTRNLVVEAHLADRDVGFVHKGQVAKLKIDTYNFTRYGLIEGRVIDISRDVINEGERQSEDNPSAGATSQRTAQPTYLIRILPVRTTMVVDGTVQSLQPGMTVTADIRTGNRSIIDYLLSPIARRTQESLHER